MDVRTATDDDVPAIVELNRDGNGHDAAVELQRAFTHGAFKATDFAVVADGPEVVSTLCLLSLQFSLSELVIPTGQPEFVVTHPAYRGRGLVRTLLDHVHRWSAERGDLFQVIAGISYFYHQFGYAYGIPFPPEQLVPPDSELGKADGWETRGATPSDISAMRALQEAVQHPFDLRVPFPDEVWPVLADLPHVELAVAYDSEGNIGGVARIRPLSSGPVRVTCVAATNVGAARALLLRARQGRPGASLVVADRVGSPISAVLAATPSTLPTGRRNWLYARVPDPAALLNHLRPVLNARMSASALRAESGQATISLYRSTLRLEYDHGAITGVSATPGVPDDDDEMPRLPPDLLARVLFGPEGVEGYAGHPDVNLGVHRELLRVLFPPIQTDVLMW